MHIFSNIFVWAHPHLRNSLDGFAHYAAPSFLMNRVDIKHQKLNQSITELLNGRVFCIQFDLQHAKTLIKTYFVIRSITEFREHGELFKRGGEKTNRRS